MSQNADRRRLRVGFSHGLLDCQVSGCGGQLSQSPIPPCEDLAADFELHGLSEIVCSKGRVGCGLFSDGWSHYSSATNDPAATMPLLKECLQCVIWRVGHPYSLFKCPLHLFFCSHLPRRLVGGEGGGGGTSATPDSIRDVSGVTVSYPNQRLGVEDGAASLGCLQRSDYGRACGLVEC